MFPTFVFLYATYMWNNTQQFARDTKPPLYRTNRTKYTYTNRYIPRLKRTSSYRPFFADISYRSFFAAPAKNSLWFLAGTCIILDIFALILFEFLLSHSHDWKCCQENRERTNWKKKKRRNKMNVFLIYRKHFHLISHTGKLRSKCFMTVADALLPISVYSSHG